MNISQTKFSYTNEALSLFKRAFDLVMQHKWLYLVPLCLLIFENLITKVSFIFNYLQVYRLRENAITNFQGFSHHFITGQQIGSVLFETIASLKLGYANVFLGLAGILITLVFLGSHQVISEKCQSLQIGISSFYQKGLQVSLIVLGLSIIPLVSTFLVRNTGFSLAVFSWVSLVAGLTNYLVFTLVGGFFLMAVQRIITSKEVEFKTVLNDVMGIIKPLFIVNILLAVPLLLHNCLSSINTVMMATRHFSKLMAESEIFLTYFNLILTLLTVAVPLFLVKTSSNVFFALKQNFQFIRKHLSAYFSIIGLGMAMLFIPVLLKTTINYFLGDLKIFAIFMSLVLDSLKLLGAVIFYIALFDFLLNPSVTEALEQAKIGAPYQTLN